MKRYRDRPGVGALRSLAVVVAAAALFGCASTAPSPQANAAPTKGATDDSNLNAIYATAQAAGGRVFKLNAQASEVRIYAFRGGAAGKLGHNHVLSAPRFTGFAEVLPNGRAGVRFDLEFRLDQLEIDNPAQRAALGGAFSTIVSPEAVEETRERMLGEANLQAGRFPLVRIHSLQITGEAPRIAAKVQVEMHGQQREMWIPLNVEGLPDRLAVSGSFVLRQSDFGVKPYSILGGAVTVEDEVVIEFRLNGT